MPKNTFKQLPKEKQERIVDAAARLFAQHGLAGTDVAQIAAQAGVAKGSLYNYFDSKNELYLHVCRDALSKSRQAVYSRLNPQWDIYQQVDHIFRCGAEFVRANPHYGLIYLHLSMPGMATFADILSLEIEQYTARHIKGVLEKGVDRGLVRRDIDIGVTAFFINSLYIVFMVSLVSRHFQIRLKEYLDIEGELDDLTLEGLLTLIVDLIHDHLRPADMPSAGR